MNLCKEKISVIIPVYNVAPYLERCLKSVIDQTYRHLEIIIVDDGSSDGSSEICDRYAHQDSRIHVIHQDNQGLSAARNVGLNIAGGEWIGFVDPDDWIDDDFYEILMEYQKRFAADIVQSAFYEVMKDHTVTHHILSGCYDAQEAFKQLENGGIYGYMVTQIYQRKLWEKVRFPSDRYSCEDARTIYKLYLQAQRIVCVDDAKYHYERRQASLTSSYLIKIDEFYSRYERYRTCQVLEAEGEAFVGCSEIFLEPLAASAYYVAYLAQDDQKQYRESGKLAKTFWKTNKHAVLKIGKGYWGGNYFFKVYFPHLVAFYIKHRSKCFRFIKMFVPSLFYHHIPSFLHRGRSW